MISERQLSEYFYSFWQDHFPLLDTMFVKRFNVEKRARLGSTMGSPALPISMGAGVKRFDLVAELAFELAIESYKKRIGSVPDTSGAIQRAFKRIALLQGEREMSSPAGNERSEASLLVGNYEHWFQTIEPEGAVQFHARIKGVGVLNEMEIDFCTAKTLFEVKAVNRNVQGSDLRQVICYIVAGLGSRQYTWSDYCIFNPRLAVSYRGRIDELLGYLSGRTAPECISDFLDALLEREQPLETTF
jgi:hypothetical protein